MPYFPPYPSGGAASWGDITGTLADQTDLTVELAAKAAVAAVELLTNKNAALGYAGLDASSKLTGSQQVYGTGANTAAEGNDSRLSNARTPTAHATTHVTGGGDTIANAIAGGNAGLMSGADKTKLDGIATGAEVNVNADWNAGSGDAQILNKPSTFAPSAHATNHKSGGTDAIKLDELAAPTDVTTLNASTSAHGLLPKLNNDAAQFLNGQGAWATPGGGSDPWTYVQVNGGSDFGTSSATAVDVTGLAFTPAANTTYEFEATLLIRTATATVNPRTGFAWPTGGTDGVVMIEQAGATATAAHANAVGNINAAVLIAVGGLLNATQSWPVKIHGTFRAGASPSGTLRVQLASETAGTTVTVKARSFLKYRTLSF